MGNPGLRWSTVAPLGRCLHMALTDKPIRVLTKAPGALVRDHQQIDQVATPMITTLFEALMTLQSPIRPKALRADTPIGTA